MWKVFPCREGVEWSRAPRTGSQTSPELGLVIKALSVTTQVGQAPVGQLPPPPARRWLQQGAHTVPIEMAPKFLLWEQRGRQRFWLTSILLTDLLSFAKTPSQNTTYLLLMGWVVGSSSLSVSITVWGFQDTKAKYFMSLNTVFVSNRTSTT